MTIGTCKDCGEVECPKDAMGLHIWYLAIDFSCHPWRTYFICKCGNKAYLSGSACFRFLKESLRGSDGN